jgi:hypothetical protein
LVFFGLMVTAGCRQILGIHDKPTGPAPVCGLDLVNACWTCAEDQCCPAIAACAGSPPCKNLATCLGGCPQGDPACRSQCSLDNPVKSDFEIAGALAACLTSDCSEPCGLSCGSVSQIAAASSAVSCQECIGENDCAPAQACGVSPDCQAYLLCRTNCVTGDCVTACASTYPTGSAIYFSFDKLMSTACQGPCEYGGNWSCVGSVAWPPAKSMTRALTIHLSRALPGVTVKLCDWTDVDCATPVDNQVSTTDSTGSVTLLDSSPTSANGQNFGLDGYLDLSEPAVIPPPLIPTLVFWNFPLSEPQANFYTPIVVVSASELDLFLSLSVPDGGVMVDTQLGIVGVTALDCLGVQAPDVTFTMTSGAGPDTRTVYVLDQPSQVGPTGTEGTAFFFNVPAGPVTITATPVVLGQVSSVAHVYVRDGALTEVAMLPTPQLPM